jgi:hypothetical protein
MWEDSIVAEVRRVREQLSAKFDFDVKAIFADIERRQAQPGHRLVPQKKMLGLSDLASPAGIDRPTDLRAE